jgi:cyclohexyl-isocyanide hydratase
LTLAAELAGDEVAKMIQLGFEYDPQPPFDCGSPEKAGPERVARYRALQEKRIEDMEEKIATAAPVRPNML